jgi:SNF2 family DNA or RNA helicase
VISYLTPFAPPGALEAAYRQFQPTPIPAGYQFKTEPRDYQRKHLERMQNLAAYAVFFDPGLGKTKVFIDDSFIARGNGVIDAAAVVCPNSIRSNWADELGIHAPEECDIFIYDPSKKKQAKAWIEKPAVAMKWFIIGVESLSSGEGKFFLENFLKAQRTSMCADESSRIKTHNAARTKTLHALAPLAIRRRILTGTAYTTGVQDGWSQFTFLSAKILNGMNYYAFRNQFCILADVPVKSDFAEEATALGQKPKETVRKMIVGAKDQDMLLDLTANYVGIETKDQLNLPPKVYQVRKIAPSEAQLAALKALDRTGMAEIDGGIVSFTNVLVKYLRMHQICGGFSAVEDDLRRILESQTHVGVDDFFDFLENGGDNPRMLQIERAMARCRQVALPGPNPKIEELLALTEEAPGKSLIWCRFRPEIEAITQALAKKYGPRSVVQFHGGCDDDQRTDARRRLQGDPECLFFVGQSRTGGIGITLTAATYAYYFSNDWGLETRIQSEDRNHRIGTTGTVLYTDLVLDYPKSIDVRILGALRSGKSFVEALVQEMKEIQR